jgi:trigger factor
MTEAELQAIAVEPQDDSSVKITGELPYALLEAHRAAAVKHLGAHLKLDGFRPGHVPEKAIVDRLGEMALLSEMAERALAAAYPAIVEHHTLDTLGYPKIEITKLAPGNPLGFAATVAVMPAIDLPDYQSIAAKVNAGRETDDITGEEVEAQIQDVLRRKAAYERLQQNAKAHEGEPETHTHADGTVHEGPAHDEPLEDIKDLPLPELTDELVRTLGQPGQFADIADFRAKIREHLEIRKKEDNASKHRAELTDAIVEKTALALPMIMIEAELGQMFAQMEEDMKRAGITMEEYLAHVKKTKDDLRAEWKPLAEKRAKLQLILNEIAKREHIEPDAADAERQTKALLGQYKNADQKRVRTYVESVLVNEKVMQMLETAGDS